MRKLIVLLVGAASAAVLALPAAAPAAPLAEPGPQFSNPRFIDNPYLPLILWGRCVSRGEEDGAEKVAIRKLLDRTLKFTINGQTVRALVVQDKSWEDGELIERALDYFAQADDGTVYYLGEDVNIFEDGEVVSHEGAWRFGRDTDVLGVAMPAAPQVGDTWMLEDVPGIAQESNTFTEHLASFTAGGKEYTDVIHIHAHVEPDTEEEDKQYARGVGPVREASADGFVELDRCKVNDDLDDD
jgi:hypothetical protein